MKSRTYFLVNDTRYDNHHGGLTVVRNLHAGMQAREWTCTGSLPVSSSPSRLGRYRQSIGQAALIIVNGEGSLHHDSRNALRLLDVCAALQKTCPVVLVNALWQDNHDARWLGVLDGFRAVYTRDRRSQQQIQALGIKAGYAPDLTFYDYPQFAPARRVSYGCTDSVLNDWTCMALQACSQDHEISFLTLFTGKVQYSRGLRDWDKRIKTWIYPWLWKSLGIKVPPRYQSLPYAIADTRQFLGTLASFRAVCVARYHALCFTFQQQVPFVAVASNAHKSESLIEEAGLPLDAFVLPRVGIRELKERLAEAIRGYAGVEERIRDFNRQAKQHIESMFDEVTQCD